MENITQNPPVEQPPIQEPIKPMEPSKTPLVVMTIFTALSLTLAGYFGYQNYQLRKQMSQVQPAPTITSLPSSTPISTTSPVANWEKYNGKAYSFLYPPTYTIKENADTNVTISNSSGVFINIFSLETPTYENFFNCTEERKTGCIMDFKSPGVFIEDTIVDGKEAKSFYNIGQDADYRHTVEVVADPKTTIQGIIGTAGESTTNLEIMDQAFNQILSTFKFTE